jgi:hypothetical protein
VGGLPGGRLREEEDACAWWGQRPVKQDLPIGGPAPHRPPHNLAQIMPKSSL